MSAAAVEMTKTCSKCRLDKPLSAFPRKRQGLHGVESECRECRLTRRQRTAALAAFPNGTTAVNAMVDAAPDRKPAVKLREELQRLRESGRSWSSAWPAAMRVAVADLSPSEAVSWRRAFNATKGAWQGSYTGTPWPVAVRPMFVPEDEPVAA